MKKKILALLLTAATVSTCAIGLSACGSGQRHQHAFDKQIAEEKYLKSSATLSDKAVYYYSCECGEVGGETFEHGEIVSLTEGLEYEKTNTGYSVIGTGTATGTTIAIPLTYNGEPVTGIAARAFSGNDELTSIIITENVTTIGDEAFSGCNQLVNITLPAALTSIGEDAFYGCTRRANIFYAGDIASWCNISGLNNLMSAVRALNADKVIPYPLTVTIDGKELVGEIVIPAGVTSIADGAFYGCDEITSVTLPDGLTSIGNKAFTRCTKLKNINIPNGVTSIGDGAFHACNELASLPIPAGVTSIGISAFAGCNKITEITLPVGITTIGDGTFNGCTELKSITIPAGVTNIGSKAFNGCINLKDITFNGTKAQWESVEKVKDDENITNWDKSTGNYTVHCTDGDVSKY